MSLVCKNARPTPRLPVLAKLLSSHGSLPPMKKRRAISSAISGIIFSESRKDKTFGKETT
jgi:hypothetical protein